MDFGKNVIGYFDLLFPPSWGPSQYKDVVLPV